MTSTHPIHDLDVLIIGAGINGAGLFRDLCEQGITCMIVDKGDFGSGTSAAPSRLIHGGLKYLETGEFGLVSESTFERNLLLKNAPHLVHPLQTVIPMFSWLKGIPAAVRTLFGSKTAARSRGALLIEAGLLIYDIYGSRRRVMPRHSFWTKSRAKAEFPPITDRIVAAGAYYDAKVSAPERLVMELVEDGLRAAPESRAMSYTSVDGQDGGVVSVTDADGKPQSFRPCYVVNAAGPWIDSVNAILGHKTKFIGGTKGSHIIIDHPELLALLKGRMIYFEGDDGRICLVYDYLGRVMVGATDIRADDPDNVRCEDDEITYFIDAVKALLPDLEITRDHIVYAYSGIRPLPASDGKAVGLITRDHSTPELDATEGRPFPIISLVGGKWTTFRGFAEEVADDLLGRLGKERKCKTSDLAIGGGHGFPEHDADKSGWVDRVAARTGANNSRVDVLLNRYGTKAEGIAMAEAAAPVWLPDVEGTSEAEIAWICENERVQHLSDLAIRRTLLAVTGVLTRSALERMANIAAKSLGWSAKRKAQEIAETTDILVTRHRMNLA